MCHRRGHRKHHAEAVEHRDLYHHAVGGREIHPVADALSVVDYVVVREHDALRKACRARGVLHIAYVVDIDVCSHSVYFLKRNGRSARHSLFPCHASLLRKADGDYIAKEGQSLCVKRGALFSAFKFGAELRHYFAVIRVLKAVDHDKRVGVRLTEQILGLVYLISGVDRDQHSAYLCHRPEGYEPLRDIRRPDRDVRAFAHSHRDKRACEGVDVVAKLGISARVVESRVPESVLIGELLHHRVKHVREGLFDYLVLLPDVRADAVLIISALVEHFFRSRGIETAHVTCKMGEYHIDIGDLAVPVGIPFDRYKTVVVDRAERIHNAVYRERPLADERV